MWVIKVKNKDRFLQRKPWPGKVTDIDHADTYRSKGAAKTALKATEWDLEIVPGMIESNNEKIQKALGIKSFDDLEIREVILSIK